MLNDLYSGALLDAAAGIPEATGMEGVQATARRTSKVCGSAVTVGLSLAEGRVSDFRLDVQACALGQASASLLAKSIIGARPEEVRRLQDEMVAMLKEEGPPPSGDRFAALKTLEPIRAYPARHASTLLVFKAAVDCLDEIEGAG